MKIRLTVVVALLTAFACWGQQSLLRNIPAVTVPPNVPGTTGGIQEALNTYSNIALTAGVYTVSNSIVLYPGMAIRGVGTNTQIRWYGRENANSTVTGNDWCCFNIRTNTFISDMDINCMIRGVNIYAACIGNASGIEDVGASNVRIERVSMHGDTDNVFINPHKTFNNVTFLDCTFESPWDTFACPGIGDCSFTFINPYIRNTGTIQNLSGVKSPPNGIATSIRLSGSSVASERYYVNVYGGIINSDDIIGSIGGGVFNFYGTRFVCGGTNFLLGVSDTIRINAYSCEGLSLSGAIPTTGGNRVAAKLNFSGPQSFVEEGAGLFTRFDGSLEMNYYNTNNYGYRSFNGIAWGDWGYQYYSNKLQVTGAATAAYNGTYTFKAAQVSATVNYVWTNTVGKFLIVTTNTDTPDYGLAAISDNQSITDGNEYAGTEGPLRKNWDDAGISVTRLMIPPLFDGSSITNLPSSEVGVTDASNATAGNVGQTITNAIPSGSATALTTATAKNVTSISLTAGDWDVSGNVNFSAATATVTGTSGGITTTSATMPTDGTEVFSGVQVTLLSETDSVTISRKQINVSSTTTVYLVGKSTFSAGSVSAFGSITARRVR